MKHAVKIELDTIWEEDRVLTFNVSMPAEKIGLLRNFLIYRDHVVTTGRDVEGHPSFNVTMKPEEILDLLMVDKTDEEEEVVDRILNVMFAMLRQHEPVERRLHLPFFPEGLVKFWFPVYAWRIQKYRIKKALCLSGYYMKHGGYDNRAAIEDIFTEVNMDIANQNASYLDHCRFYKHEFFNTGLEILTGLVDF